MPRKTKPKLLSGGNPQIPKGDGDEPLQPYIAAMPGWKHTVGRKLDDLITRTLPNPPGVRKAVKWNTPFYGVAGREDDGWFLSFHCFTNYIKTTFFAGSSLNPPPPETSKHDHIRYPHIHENEWDDEYDEAQLAEWIKQASMLPGEIL